MSQLSRPYQIALLAVLVFAAAWFVVLKPHHPSESGGASAPGLHGFTRDVSKAHEAAGTTQRRDHEIEHAANQVGASAPRTGGTQAKAPAKAPARTQAKTPAKATARTPAKGDPTSATRQATKPASQAQHASQRTAGGSRATRLSRQLHEGRTVLLLFWNPQASADISVRKQVQAVAHSLGHKVAASYAKPKEVGSFGTVTRDVTVNQTPTLLLINPQGEVNTLTGLTDAFAIEQAIREAEAR